MGLGAGVAGHLDAEGFGAGVEDSGGAGDFGAELGAFGGGEDVSELARVAAVFVALAGQPGAAAGQALVGDGAGVCCSGRMPARQSARSCSKIRVGRTRWVQIWRRRVMRARSRAAMGAMAAWRPAKMVRTWVARVVM